MQQQQQQQRHRFDMLKPYIDKLIYKISTDYTGANYFNILQYLTAIDRNRDLPQTDDFIDRITFITPQLHLLAKQAFRTGLTSKATHGWFNYTQMLENTYVISHNKNMMDIAAGKCPNSDICNLVRWLKSLIAGHTCDENGRYFELIVNAERLAQIEAINLAVLEMDPRLTRKEKNDLTQYINDAKSLVMDKFVEQKFKPVAEQDDDQGDEQVDE